MSQTKRTYRLDVTYNLQFRSARADTMVERAVGAKIEASGGGMGARDLSFYFTNKRALDAAKRRLQHRYKKLGFPVVWSDTWWVE